MAVHGEGGLETPLLGLLRLPRVQRVMFERTPLAMVLCQVSFTRVLGIADPVFVFPFQRAIQPLYPVTSQVQGVELQIGFGPEGGTVQQQESRPSQWHFADREDTWRIILAGDSVVLQTRAYTEFSEFLERLRDVLAALSEHIQPQLATRVGLRYVNEIRPNGMDWPSVIHPTLLGPTGAAELGGTGALLQSVQQIALRYPHDRGVNVTHGVFPVGAVVQPRPDEPTPDGPFYLLDFDAYREFPLPASLPMDPDAICHHVMSFHDVIHTLFRWSLTEQYTRSLGVASSFQR